MGDSLLSLEKPAVMGIVNVTPDSFYKLSRMAEANVVEAVESMLTNGAAIIDIGAQSTRPGATLLCAEEELKRALPVIKLLVNKFPKAHFSIDTFWSGVAWAAVNEGVQMVNDISAGNMDEQMFPIIAKAKCAYGFMHMQGVPATMQVAPTYKNVTLEVLDFLKQKLFRLQELGVIDLVIDPGFGFGKTLENNFSLLNHLEAFRILDIPMMVGLSRKSMITKTLEIKAEEALNGTTALHMAALMKGAKILRVHDVKEAVEVCQLYSAINLSA